MGQRRRSRTYPCRCGLLHSFVAQSCPGTGRGTSAPSGLAPTIDRCENVWKNVPYLPAAHRPDVAEERRDDVSPGQESVARYCIRFFSSWFWAHGLSAARCTRAADFGWTYHSEGTRSAGAVHLQIQQMPSLGATRCQGAGAGAPFSQSWLRAAARGEARVKSGRSGQSPPECGV